MVDDVSLRVDRQFATIELSRLYWRQIQRPAVDDVKLVGELPIERCDRLWPFRTWPAEQFVFDQEHRAAHEAAGVVVGDALDRSRNDEVGKDRDGHEGAHDQQVEVEEQPGQAVAPSPGRRLVSPEDGEQLVAIASHAC
ncbi:MAG: hypothetical protein V5B59_17720 [Candidatus Accumulibacter contiguus]